MRLGASAALSLVLVLSGCAADEDGDLSGVVPSLPSDVTEAAETGSGLFAADGSAALPVWNVGDWWQYRVVYQSGETYNAKIVVYRDDGGNYYLTSDTEELLLRSTISHYPTFGPVTKSSLEHDIHGVKVGFLRFPMQNGTWERPFRDFTGSYSSTYAVLPTGQGDVPGFLTTMTDTADGNVRFVNGWSPVTKYFTRFAWDFDGVEPIDVEFTLQDWGDNYTGALYELELTEGVHRPFPAYSLAAAPPGGPGAAAPEPSGAFTVPPETDILLAFFGGAGGPGNFEISVQQNEGAQFSYYPWRPTAPSSYFEWAILEDPSPGSWHIFGSGAAQEFAFLFLEAYAFKTVPIEFSPTASG